MKYGVCPECRDCREFDPDLSGLKYNFHHLPGQEGGQGDGRPDLSRFSGLSGFSTLLKLVVGPGGLMLGVVEAKEVGITTPVEGQPVGEELERHQV